MRRTAALIAAAGGCSALTEEYVRANGATLFANFKAAHGKAYAGAGEEKLRYEIFHANMIEAAQLEKQNPRATFGASKFADLSKAEFQSYHNMRVPGKPSPPPMFSAEQVRKALDGSIDWRSKGAVTQVKDQAKCGGCWAFSSTGGIEGQWFTAGNKLTSVSEQELIACDKVDNGCGGGLMDSAYQWLKGQGGKIVTEEAYPYTAGGGVSGTCKDVSGMAVGATIDGHRDIVHDETQMATYLQTSGPLPIAVDAQSHWQTYTGGVISNCNGKSLDHGVLAVGYTADYWIVKNSWGPSWGESGYIRLAFGTNQCGLNQSPTAPLVTGAPTMPPNPTPPPMPIKYHCEDAIGQCVQSAAGHSTMAKCQDACTPVPTPPDGVFLQIQCDDSACSYNCKPDAFPINQCLQLNGGGSALVTQCDASGMTMKQFPISTTCTGLGMKSTQPVDQCSQGSDGTYFINECSTNSSAGRGSKLYALPVLSELGEIARRVNSAQTSWAAEEPSRFGSVADVKALCGTFLKDHPDYVQLPELNTTFVSAGDLPTDFDSRTAWPKCTVISKVRDQSACGSCWAFGSTEAFEDRRCIATGEDIEMSAEDTAACCGISGGALCGMSMGCNGGQPGAALQWMASTGVVTGGDYFDKDSGSSCLPYSLKPCAHHVPATSKYPVCPSAEYKTPKCTKACSDSGYTTSYADDKKKAVKAFGQSGETKIMSSLMKNGPLSAAFTVYSDFPTYKTGVYKHTTGSQLGGHAVEFVGWGVDGTQKYWLVKNSWNEQWGDGGFFKIARGVNECGIEGQINGVEF